VARYPHLVDVEVPFAVVPGISLASNGVCVTEMAFLLDLARILARHSSHCTLNVIG
jgi:hypothetical protein